MKLKDWNLERLVCHAVAVASSLSWLIVGQVFLARFPGITALTGHLRLPCRKRHVGSPLSNGRRGIAALASTFAEHDLPLLRESLRHVVVVRIAIDGVKYWLSLKIQTRLPLPVTARRCHAGWVIYLWTTKHRLLPPTVVSLFLRWSKDALIGTSYAWSYSSFRFHCFRQLIKPAFLMEMDSSVFIDALTRRVFNFIMYLQVNNVRCDIIMQIMHVL